MRKTFITLIALLAVSCVFGQEEGDSIRYNQYGVPVSRTKLLSETRNGILVLESPDQNYRFWFDIRVQVDGGLFFKGRDYMDPIGNGIINRRTRFAVKTQISDSWYGEIDTDFGDGDFELKDVFIRYTGLRNWDFSLGNFKEDFSMEQTTSSRYLAFMERPMAVQAFAPSRHLGFTAKYQDKWFYGSAGVAFQTVDNAETATNVNDNNKDYGRNQGLSYTAKAIFMPLYKKENQGIHIGLGASYRTPKTDASPSTYGGLRYNVRNATAINRKKYLDTDVIPYVDHQWLYNVELAGYYRKFRFQSEYIGNQIKIEKDAPVTADTRTKRFSGWYAQAGYLLFGGMQRYDRSSGEFTQSDRGRKWGDMELLLRYDYIDLNSKNIYGGSGENYTVGLNYYINNSVKFALNYQFSNNDRYANGRGKYNIGTDSKGNPTSNYMDAIQSKGKAGIRYNMIAFRMEIDF